MRVNILTIIRESRVGKSLAVFLAFVFLTQFVFPTLSYALTSGPAQEEFASFEPVSTSDMVDIYSGDFNYNIPLLSVPGPNGGYPINLAYHSGVGMDQEASWVGLGWNINVGAINRQLRGLPDDFKGDEVTQTMNLRTNTSIGYDLPLRTKSEIFGVPPKGNACSPLTFQVYYNNYKGLGYRVLTTCDKASGNNLASVGVGISLDSQNGIGLEPNIGLSSHFGGLNSNFKFGLSMNSRQGLQDYSFSSNLSAKSDQLKKTGDYTFDFASGGGGGGSSSLSFSTAQGVPSVSIPTKTNTYPFDIKIGKSPIWGSFNSKSGLISGYVSRTIVANREVIKDAYGYLNTNIATSSQTNQDNFLKDFQRDNIPYSKKVPNLSPSTHSYDLFMQTGQGTGGMFRPYSSSIGILTDPLQESASSSIGLNLEFGTGPTPPPLPAPPLPTTVLHAGAGSNLGYGSHTSGNWQDVSGISGVDGNLKQLDFGGSGEPEYEPYYFQMYGEKTGILDDGNEDQLSVWQGDLALRIKLKKSSGSYLNKQFLTTPEFLNTEPDPAIPIGLFSYSNTTDLHKYRKKRQRRGTSIQMLTEDEAVDKDLGLTKTIGYTVVNSPQFPAPGGSITKVLKTTKNLPHHISEYSILQKDGMRYVYGLPAYNTSQMDATFSVENGSGSSCSPLPNQGDFNTSFVGVPNDGTFITPEPERPELETSPYPEFLSQTELPAYVHSWLLTAVVSADYVDLLNDGPTDDDYGYWVKFNYEKESSNYKWRVPYQDAMFSEGNKSDPTDDKGSFTYGEKDLYYLTSIESKTHIALFELSAREDANEATGKFMSCSDIPGGGEKMQKLDKIKLYTKKDYISCVPDQTDPSIIHNAINVNAIPIKVVNFKYSYALCPNVPNNSGAVVNETINGNTVDINANQGKLTLRKLFFTYQNSTRGEFSPYVFKYVSDANADANGIPLANTAENPNYNNRDIDRWGNYKPNSITYQHTPGDGNEYPYVDFPYTEQIDYDKNSATYLRNKIPTVAVWSLKEIDLPSGGTIHVNYESDEYGYVESKRATTMFDIVGIDHYQLNGEKRSDYSVRGNFRTPPNPYKIYFKLDSLTKTDIPDSYINTNYINGLDSIYFKVESNIANGNRDYVSGYAEIDPLGCGLERDPATLFNGDCQYGFISVLPVKISKIQNTKVNPIQKAAIEHLRANRSELIHAPIPNVTGLLDQVGSLIGSVFKLAGDIAQTTVGFNWWAFKTKHFGEEIYLNGRSVIRLQDPDGQKYGGGVRVKQLSINDNWKNTTTADAFDYGQSYDYRISENGNLVSSGVAYEPHIGGDESALRSPVNYPLSTPLSSNYHLFVENPVLESYYPGPSVGYRKVTVRSIAPLRASQESSNTNLLSKSAAPISIYEFFTPKDFPVIADQTDLNSHPPITRFLLIPGIYSAFRKRKARSQGYSIVLNDMAGKLKSLTQQTITGTVISRQEYIYHTLNDYDPTSVNRLSSKVQVLTSEGSYQTATIGQTHDIFVDLNENKDSNIQGGIDLNLDMDWTLAPAVFFYIMPLINSSESETSLRTAVTMKIIHRTGILKEVITTTDESVIKTENIAYDLETGEPLLTKVTNEFKDDIFNLSFPAHWFYGNMGGAYKNVGLQLNPPPAGLAIISPGHLDIPVTPTSVSTAADYFTEGDEVFLSYVPPGPPPNACQPLNSVYTVAHVHSGVGSNFINLIDRCGSEAPAGSIQSLKIIRSGYRNLVSQKAGNLVAKSMMVTPFDPKDISTTRKTVPTSFTIDQNNKIIDASVVQFSDKGQTVCISCVDPGEPEPESAPACLGLGILCGQIVNPWSKGLNGIWKPRRSFAYSTMRLQNSGTIREDGTFVDFSLFDWRSPFLSSTKWIAANTITKYSPFGFELENKDAIGRYSAALYEHDNSLVSVVGSNTMMREIAFDGFEDYNASCQLLCPQIDHWGFSETENVQNIVSTQAHTGSYSIQAPLGQNPSVLRGIFKTDCEEELLPLLPGAATPSIPDPLLDYVEYESDNCDCIGLFSPTDGKKYVLSAWVKEISAAQTVPVNTLPTYLAPKVKVEIFTDATLATVQSTQTFFAKGRIIEGWQRIFDSFDIPAFAPGAPAPYIKVSLLNTSSNDDVYFDDIRIHPFDGNIVSYVYDPVTLKLVAELDANNYATFYVYDDEGQLTKIKKETIDGIKTIREGRTNNVVK